MWVLLAVIFAQSVDYSAEGMKALDAQKYDAAVELFTKAIAQDPKDYGARFNLALAYGFQGKDAESIPQYKAVLELKPGLYEAELNLGISLLRSKDAAGAAAQLKAAAEQKPSEFRPVFYLGEALRETGSLADAEAAYTKSAALKPDSAEAEWGLAQTLLKEKKLADAEPHFRKAAALNAKYKSYLLELAQMLEADHQTENAIALYREFPDDPAAREHAGALLVASGDPAAAVGSLEAAVAKSPTAANRVALAQAYLMTKQEDKALAVTSQLVAAEPQAYRRADVRREAAAESAQDRSGGGPVRGGGENQTRFGGGVEGAQRGAGDQPELRRRNRGAGPFALAGRRNRADNYISARFPTIICIN